VLSRLRKTTDGKKDPCLIYSIGDDGNHSFEHGIMDLFGEDVCEIHTFDSRSLAEMGNKDRTNAQRRKTSKINLHYSWGLLGSDEPPKPGFKTLKQTIKELNHVGRTIDIFKIDCEGCEWKTFSDWADDDTPATLHQILVEVHSNPVVAQDFFETMRKNGYVIFHKEPNIQFGGGLCVEYGFLKLHPKV